MIHTPIAVKHRISNAVLWYGEDYDIKRAQENQYHEKSGDYEKIQTIRGIYHSDRQSFIDLVSVEGGVVKSKYVKGILCMPEPKILANQGDMVMVNDTKYFVTAVEPIQYGDVIIAMEISIDEKVEVN